MILGQKLLKLYLCEKIHRLLRQRSENPERLPRKSGRDPHLCVYLQNAEAFTFPKQSQVNKVETASPSAATRSISFLGDPLSSSVLSRRFQRPYAFLFDE
jgi:hypothetical protein